MTPLPEPAMVKQYPDGTVRNFYSADQMRTAVDEIAKLEQEHQALSNDINDYQNTIAALKTLVANVHKAKGRYHSQIAMCALYDACGLPNVKPISGGKS